MKTIIEDTKDILNVRRAEDVINYEEYFLDGKPFVGLIVKYSDSSLDEYLTFKDLAEMEACALDRPYIPRSVWEKLCEAIAVKTEFHNSLS